MIWLIYEDFFKKKIKARTLLKDLKWYNWIISFFLLIIALIFIVLSSNQSNLIYIVGYILFSALIGLYLGSTLKNIKLKKYGSVKQIYFKEISDLNEMLNLYKIKNVD